MALASHASAIQASALFVHFFEGFRVSHQVETMSLITDDQLLKIIDFDAV
jgi:pyruvate-ferredoxin/flavodoxin oxidoreductase